MHQRDLGALHLARTTLAAQLPDRLGNREHRAGMPGMTMRQQAAVGIDRKFTTEFDASARQEAAALALWTKAEILKFDDHDRREAIVQLGNVYVFWSETCHCVSALACFFGSRGREIQGLSYVL